MELWLLFAFLSAGFLSGYSGVLSPRLLKAAERIVELGLIILLAAMGARIGINQEIINQLDEIGVQAFLISTASIAGSLLLVKLIGGLVKSGVASGRGVSEKKAEGKQGSRLITIKIAASVFSGIILGLILPAGYVEELEIISSAALAVLLLGIGIELGSSRQLFRGIKRMGWKILLLPLMVALGSIGGSLLVAGIVGLAANQAAAVGAGFGWYSLSGVLLTRMHSVELGSTAFLANVFREVTSILILPLVDRYLGRFSVLAPGGATTMDSTLPVIKKVAGAEMALPAVINGAVLSFLVPLLVPLLINL